MKYNSSIQIGEHIIDINSPVYFVADIAANHNGDLSIAKELIWLAKDAGANPMTSVLSFNRVMQIPAYERGGYFGNCENENLENVFKAIGL